MRTGERGNMVVYANTLIRTEEQDDGSEEERQVAFMKAYTVFNVEQIEGLPEHYYAKPEPIIDPAQRIEHAETFIAATGADIRHGGSDHVQMPCFERFNAPEAYYATLAHELTHYAVNRIMPHSLSMVCARRHWSKLFGINTGEVLH